MDEKKQQNKISDEEYFENPELAEEITKDTNTKKNTDGQTEHFEQKLKQSEEQAKRYLADYQNLHRRVQEERGQWIRQANKDLLLKLLPVLDTLMLAAKHINDKGLEISISQFLSVLEAEGVKRIKAKGEKFDPKTMEAIGTAEGKKDIVIEEARVGFRLYDSVLRSAQVIVGQ